MTCAACGHDNRADREFCAECGAALALACAACGTPYVVRPRRNPRHAQHPAVGAPAVCRNPRREEGRGPGASLSIAHTFGTLAEDGQYESVHAMIMVYGRDWLVGVEIFEPDALDAARARFEELCLERRH